MASKGRLLRVHRRVVVPNVKRNGMKNELEFTSDCARSLTLAHGAVSYKSVLFKKRKRKKKGFSFFFLHFSSIYFYFYFLYLFFPAGLGGSPANKLDKMNMPGRRYIQYFCTKVSGGFFFPSGPRFVPVGAGPP